MSRDEFDSAQPVMVASLLDRLLDDDEREPLGYHVGSGELEQGLRRDIEAMLNTHQYTKGLPTELKELSESLLDYGMPLFLGLSSASEPAREQFRSDVETALRRFEPRLTQVSVTLLDNTDKLDRTLRFRIEARMLVTPDLQPVCFDSVLEPANRRFSVTTVET
jgi:type VI secretion system protein ImpF